MAVCAMPDVSAMKLAFVNTLVENPPKYPADLIDHTRAHYNSLPFGDGISANVECLPHIIEYDKGEKAMFIHKMIIRFTRNGKTVAAIANKEGAYMECSPLGRNIVDHLICVLQHAGFFLPQPICAL